jgi:hypothetical protein
MKKESKKITVGKAVKYKKVKFNVAKIIAAYKSGTPVSQIAQAAGYPPNTGNNRVRNLLMRAGLYGKPAKKRVAKAA